MSINYKQIAKYTIAVIILVAFIWIFWFSGNEFIYSHIQEGSTSYAIVSFCSFLFDNICGGLLVCLSIIPLILFFVLQSAILVLLFAAFFVLLVTFLFYDSTIEGNTICLLGMIFFVALFGNAISFLFSNEFISIWNISLACISDFIVSMTHVLALNNFHFAVSTQDYLLLANILKYLLLVVLFAYALRFILACHRVRNDEDKYSDYSIEPQYRIESFLYSCVETIRHLGSKDDRWKYDIILTTNELRYNGHISSSYEGWLTFIAADWKGTKRYYCFSPDEIYIGNNNSNTASIQSTTKNLYYWKTTRRRKAKLEADIIFALNKFISADERWKKSEYSDLNYPPTDYQINKFWMFYPQQYKQYFGDDGNIIKEITACQLDVLLKELYEERKADITWGIEKPY